ncbi:MAG: ATP synthase F1 subunit epsilon [Planctomycetaceae bacterium]
MAGSRVYEVVVVSPARPLYRGEAAFVAVEGLSGKLGIAPRHADLVAALGTGPLRIEKPGKGVPPDRFVVRGGFLKVGKGRVTILVDQAVRPEEVDEPAVRKELEEALAGLRHPRTDDEFEQLLARRAWAQARLAILR